VAVLARVLLAALAGYLVTGLVYAAGMTTLANAFAEWPFFSPRPWSSASTFVGWFVGQAASWPLNLIPIRGLWEILVPSVYLATLGLFYLAASRRSAPRRLKSTYPDNH
jgi:hypothetical protein